MSDYEALMAQQSADTPPMPRACGRCEADIPWRRYTTRTGREVWAIECADGLCANCSSYDGADERLRLRDAALERSRLPVKHWGWSFDRVTHQKEGESPAEFQQRIRNLRGHIMGVLSSNREVVAEIADWHPAAGSAMLCGPVGSGKTTVIGALLEKLATPGEAHWRERTEAELRSHYGDKWERVTRRRVRVQPQSIQVLYVDEGELMERVKSGWSGDKDPLKRYASTRVLFIDDMGAEMAGASDGWRSQVAKAVGQLVRYRYDNNLTMFIGTNLRPEQVSRRFGARTWSRLSEMLRGQVWSLDGDDWRRV